MTAAQARRIVRVAWETGRDYLPPGIEEAVDDMRHANLASPARSHEQRVADRMQECARLGAPDPFPGGPTRLVGGVLLLVCPVPWVGGPDRVPAAARAGADHDRERDARILAVAGRAR